MANVPKGLSVSILNVQYIYVIHRLAGLYWKIICQRSHKLTEVVD